MLWLHLCAIFIAVMHASGDESNSRGNIRQGSSLPKDQNTPPPRQPPQPPPRRSIVVPPPPPKRIPRRPPPRPILLNSDALMPMIGLGTWKIDPEDVGQVVEGALRIGYSHLDCAAIYGNEKAIGKALAALTVPRSKLFITSKLWNSEHAPKNVRPALEWTLSDLKLDYLDLYLVHWPQAFAKVKNTHVGRPKHANGSMVYDLTTSIEATWAAMEKLVDDGLVKSIGLSNFNQQQIEAILRVARIKPAVLQIESHPFLAQQSLVNFCKKHDIVVTAYSPLGSGATMQGHPIASHPVLQKIAVRQGVTAAQIAIAWQLERGVVVIPKSSTLSRLHENMDAMSVKLTDEDMAQIDKLDYNRRVGWGGAFVRGKPRDISHPLYPFAWKPPPRRDEL